MQPRRLSKALAPVLALCLAACGGSSADSQVEPGAKGQEAAESVSLGLFTTLPIYWGEGADIGSMLDGASDPGWVRPALEKRATLVPLDTLEQDSLEGLGHVVLAQPRPLAPSENVAFDSWLREGGRALIFADPLLTQHSDYPLGDPRRPHDMVVMSPLFARWGLELRFDDRQPEGERLVGFGDGEIPVDLAGEFALAGNDARADCSLSDGGLIARCKLGEGEVTLVADAALVDDHFDSPQRRAVLDTLVGEALSE